MAATLAVAALIIGGWLHLLGAFMVTSGFVGMHTVGIDALRGGHDRR